MISYDNAAKLIFAKGNDSSALNLKSKTVTPSGSDFKAVFSNAVSGNSTDRREAYSSASRSERELVQSSEQKPRYNSFRELRTEQTSDSNLVKANLSSDSLQSKERVGSEFEESQKPEAIDEQIGVLAQMLGISPNDLLKLAKELGLTSEQLKNSTELEGFVQKLGEVLQLDNSQKEVLSKLVQQVVKQVPSDNSSDNRVAEMEVHTAPSALKAESGLTENDRSKLTADIKEAIDKMLQKGITEAEAIGTEISKVIEAMKAAAQQRLAAVKTPVAETAKLSGENIGPALNTIEGNVAAPGTEAKAGDKISVKDEDESLKSGDKASAVEAEKSVDTKNTAADINSNTNQKDQQLQTFAAVKPEFISNNTDGAKAVFKMPTHNLKPSEIVNQVVEQTKVVLGQDKTEMVIHLKPDHLGKLELKVVTEQGIVAAKIIAESQQVKEIIETNMQLLKDSLQKQGIAIDGVSVQVGKDPQNEYRQNSNESRNNGVSNRMGAKIPATAITGPRGSIIETLPDRLAQYSYETNTINLTA